MKMTWSTARKSPSNNVRLTPYSINPPKSAFSRPNRYQSVPAPQRNKPGRMPAKPKNTGTSFLDGTTKTPGTETMGVHCMPATLRKNQTSTPERRTRGGLPVAERLDGLQGMVYPCGVPGMVYLGWFTRKGLPVWGYSVVPPSPRFSPIFLPATDSPVYGNPLRVYRQISIGVFDAPIWYPALVPS